MAVYSVGTWRRGGRLAVFAENKLRVAAQNIRAADYSGGGKVAVPVIQAVVGFAAGVIASMGLGGGFVLMVWLTMFAGIEQRAAQGINLLFFLPIALLSLIIHIKGGLINKRLLKKYILGGIIGAILGTLAAQLVASALLGKLFSLFLLAFGVRELFSAGKKPQEEQQ